MINLVSELSPAKSNGHKINIYFNVNQGIISCSALCITCLSRGADNAQQRKDPHYIHRKGPFMSTTIFLVSASQNNTFLA